MEEAKAGRLIDDIVNALNAKHKESRGILEGKKERPKVEKEVREETEAERLDRVSEEIGPHKRESRLLKAEEEALRKAIEAKYMESEKEDLKLRLRQKMSFGNTSTNKPMLWSRLALEQSGIYDDYQSILQKLIDPKLIFFSEDLGTTEVETCKDCLMQLRHRFCQDSWIAWASRPPRQWSTCARRWRPALPHCASTSPATTPLPTSLASSQYSPIDTGAI